MTNQPIAERLREIGEKHFQAGFNVGPVGEISFETWWAICSVIEAAEEVLDSFSPHVSAWEAEHPAIDGERLYEQLRNTLSALREKLEQ